MDDTCDMGGDMDEICCVVQQCRDFSPMLWSLPFAIRYTPTGELEIQVKGKDEVHVYKAESKRDILAWCAARFPFRHGYDFDDWFTACYGDEFSVLISECDAYVGVRVYGNGSRDLVAEVTSWNGSFDEIAYGVICKIGKPRIT